MIFESTLLPNEHIIDDVTARLHVRDFEAAGEIRKRGRIPRDYSLEPYGALEFAKPFDIPLIPRVEWPERIEEMERTKTRLSDILLQTYQTDKPVKSLDQDGTNYCWCNAVITAIEALRCMMGLPYIKLSPASVAAIIKNFRNQGGWGGEALEHIVQHGVASVEFWPPNAISRQYWTDAMKTNALLHLVNEWLELRPRNFDQKMTMLFNRIPVPSGYDWWSHETCGFDPVLLNRSARSIRDCQDAIRLEAREMGSRWTQEYLDMQLEVAASAFGCRDRNSWSDSYGDRGFFVLTESKGTPDDAVAPQATLPSLV